MSDPATPARVLVVEDSFLAAEAVSGILRDLGHTVVGPVPSNEAALLVLDEETVDVAILDVNVRGELVTPVADRLRELGRPFAFLTAYSGLQPLPSVYHDFPRVTKPCATDALGALITSLLDRRPA